MRADTWDWRVGAAIGAVAFGALSAIVVASGQAADYGALGSPPAAAAGGAVWGVFVVWVRNRATRR